MKKLKSLILILITCITCIGTVTTLGLAAEHDSATSQQDNTSETSTTVAAYNKIKKITLNRSTLTITKRKKGALSATISYSTTNNSNNESVVWTSKDTSIATVSQDGIIKAVNSGKTYIICSSKSGAVKARCKIVVRKPYNTIKKIKLDKTEIRLNKKDSRVLTPVIKYKGNTKYPNEPITWSSTNEKVATVSKKGVVKGKSKGTAYIKVKSKYSNKTAKCKVVVQKTKYVAFTFDDGPGIYTDKLLDSLSKNHCQATFFVLGNRVDTYEKELKRAYSLGMEIGSHTYSHQNLNALSKDGIAKEISKTNKAVKKIIGVKPTLLRPPYGNYNKTVSKKAGVPMIYWTVDTLDWKTKNTKKVYKAILNNTKDGDIVLLHDIHKTSVNGFIKALPKLREKGFELVTVSELYKIKGKKLKKGKMHFGPNND